MADQTTLMCTIQKWGKTSGIYLPPHVPQTWVVGMKQESFVHVSSLVLKNKQNTSQLSWACTV